MRTSDWANDQTDLSLRWAHVSLCWFCHAAAHLNLLYFILVVLLLSVCMTVQNTVCVLGRVVRRECDRSRWNKKQSAKFALSILQK